MLTTLIDVFIIIFTMSVLSYRYKWCNFFDASAIFIVFFTLHAYSGMVVVKELHYLPELPCDEALGLARNSFFIIVISFIFVKELFAKKLQLQKFDIKSINADFQTDERIVHYFSLICILLSIIYLLLIPRIPIIAAFSSSADYAKNRELATTAFPLYGFFKYVFAGFLPILSVYYYFKDRYCKSIILFGTGIFVFLSTGQKSPLIYFLILYFVAYGIKNKKMFSGKMLLLGIASFIALFCLAVLYSGRAFFSLETIYFIFKWMGLRIFVGGVDSLLRYVDYFSNFHGFLSINHDVGNLARLIYTYYVGSEIQGNMNSPFIGDIFAIFGGNLLGFYIMVLSASVCFFVCDVLFFSKIKTPLHASCYVYFSSLSIMPAMTSFSVFFFRTFYTLCFFMGLILVFNMLKSKSLRIVETRSPIIALVSFLICLLLLRNLTLQLFTVYL